MYLSGLALMIVAMYEGTEVHQISAGSITFQPTQLGIAGGIVLMGSLLLFVILALAMWVTRRVDWYALGADLK